MSPDMCPDIISNIYISEDEVQLHNPIPDSVLEQYKQINACKEFTLSFNLRPCNCALCKHNFERVGIKKAIKWNSNQYNIYKKQLKRLRDKGIRSGSLTSENKLEVQYAVAEQMVLYHLYLCNELRFLRKQGRIIIDLH